MPHSPGDLSSRYLPDVSDTSFSFQIPTANQDFLLADDDDFLKTANDSLSTPIAASKVAREREPLTLSQLTPKPKSKTKFKERERPNTSHPSQDSVFTQISSKPVSQNRRDENTTERKTKPETRQKHKLAPRPTPITLAPSPGRHSAAERFEHLKAEVKTLVNDSDRATTSTGTKPEIASRGQARVKRSERDVERVKPVSKTKRVRFF